MFGKPKLVLIFLSATVVVYGLLGGMLKDVSAKNDVYGQLEMFTTVLSRLKSEYVEKPDMERAMNGALLGMIEAVDPFSSFVEKDTFETLAERAETGASTGLVLSKRHGYAYVVSVIAGSPAEEAGIRTGDIVEAIEGKVTTEMSLWEVVQRLKGRQGSDVTIRVVRPRKAQPVEMTLTRLALGPGEVRATLLEDGIGLLVVPSFEKGIADTVASKLRLLKGAGLEALILDLRGTTQGELEEAARVADLFLDPGKVIAVVAGREGNEKTFVAEQEAVVKGLPIGLLIDGGTSGPAEVLSAALVDDQGAFSVGLRTNGHGTIQQKFTLEDGSVVFLATHLILRPSGDPLQGKTARTSGVRPEKTSPSQDFVTNFYFENAADDMNDEQLEEFYRKLDAAVAKEQLTQALEEMHKRVLKKAA